MGHCQPFGACSFHRFMNLRGERFETFFELHVIFFPPSTSTRISGVTSIGIIFRYALQPFEKKKKTHKFFAFEKNGRIWFKFWIILWASPSQRYPSRKSHQCINESILNDALTSVRKSEKSSIAGSEADFFRTSSKVSHLRGESPHQWTFLPWLGHVCSNLVKDYRKFVSDSSHSNYTRESGAGITRSHSGLTTTDDLFSKKQKKPKGKFLNHFVLYVLSAIVLKGDFFCIFCYIFSKVLQKKSDFAFGK